MTIRKLKDILLGGQPLARNAPAGAPPETRFLGRNESLASETINRGVYAVAEQLDLVFADFLALSRKAVTKADQKRFSVGIPTNYFEQTSADPEPTNAYVGTVPEDSPSRLLEILQPGSPVQYDQATNGAYTVYELSGGVLSLDAQGGAVIAFQVRTLPAYTGTAQIRFSNTGVNSLTVTPSGDDIDILVTYDGTRTFANVATAINNANTRVVAYGTSAVVLAHVSVNPADAAFPPTHSEYVPLHGRDTADALVEGVLINNPLSGEDFTVPERCVVRYDAVNEEFVIVTAFPGGAGNPIVSDDYVMLSAHAPSTVMAEPGPVNVARSTGRHKVLKVSAGYSVHNVGQVFKVDADFTMLADLGYTDLPTLDADHQVLFVLSRFSPEFWAIGNTHAYDRLVPGFVNPMPFEFGDSDGLHWFQGTGGIPFVDFASDSQNITRVANFKSVFTDPTTITKPSQFTGTDINKEIVFPGLPMLSGLNRLNILVQPRFAGNSVGFPKVALADLRFVFNAVLDPATSVEIRASGNSDPEAAFAVALRATFFEYVGATADGKPIYRLDPYTVTDGASYAPLFDTNSNFYYYVKILAAVGDASNTLERIFFKGTHAASPIIRFRSNTPIPPNSSRTFSFTDLELWVVQSSLVPVTNIKVDLYLSSTGKSRSYSKIAAGIVATASHVVSTGAGPLVGDKIVAYRAQAFPEGFDLTIDSEQQSAYVMAHVQQEGIDPVDYLRVVNALLASSHRNSDQQIGAFVGANMTGKALNPPTQTNILLGGQEIRVTAPGDGVQSGAPYLFDDANSPTMFSLVQAGDWLHIIDSAAGNEGTHRIAAVLSGTQLELATPVGLNTDATAVTYEVIRDSNAVYPAGIEGGSQRFAYVTNVDIEGIGSQFDLGVGSYAQFRDLPPDGLRSTAGSFGDAGALTAKIAEIMGEPFTNPVPLDRNLVGLDGRIRALNVVTIGLGTLSPLSYGQFNVSDYASINATVAAAISSLPPEGGVILFKPGTYGTGVDGNLNPLPSNVFASNLAISTADVVLAAESPRTVRFDLGGSGTARSVLLNASGTAARNIHFASSVAFASTPTDWRNALWVGGAGVSTDLEGIRATGCTFEGETRLVIGTRDGGATYRLAYYIDDLVLDDLDLSLASSTDCLVVNVDFAHASPNRAIPKLRRLQLNNIKTFSPASAGAAKQIKLSQVDRLKASRVWAQFELYHSVGAVLESMYVYQGVISGCAYVLVDGVEVTHDSATGLTLESAFAASPLEAVVVTGVTGRSFGVAALSDAAVQIRTANAGFARRVVVFGVEYSPSLIDAHRNAPAVHLNAGGSVGASDVRIDKVSTSYNAGVRVTGNVVRTLINGVAAAGYLAATASTIGAVQLSAGLGEVMKHVIVRGVVSYVSSALALFVNNRQVVEAISTSGSGIQDLIVADVSAYGPYASSPDAKVYLTNCARVQLSTLQLGSSQGAVVETTCTQVQKMGVQDSTSQAIRLPDGKSITAETRGTGASAMADGKEVEKYGIGEATTFRTWKYADVTYLTQNVASLAVPPLTTIVQEDPTKGSVLIELGNSGSVAGKFAVHVCEVGGTTPKKIWEARSGSMTSATEMQMLMAVHQLLFGGSDVRIDLFDPAGVGKAVVFSQNFALGLNNHSAAFNGSNWTKVSPGNSAAALVFTGSAGPTGKTIRLYQVPAAVLAPVAIDDYLVLATDDAGVVVGRGLRGETPAVSVNQGINPAKFVPYTGSPLFVKGRDVEQPGIIIAPQNDAVSSIIFGLGDELASLAERMSVVSSSVILTPLPSGNSLDLFRDKPSGVTWATGSTGPLSVNVNLAAQSKQILVNGSGVMRVGLKFRTPSALNNPLSWVQESLPLSGLQTVKVYARPTGGALQLVTEVTKAQLANMMGGSLESNKYWLLPAFNMGLLGSGLSQLTLELSFAGTITADVVLERVYLYHGSSSLIGNICPTWEDFENNVAALGVVRTGKSTSFIPDTKYGDLTLVTNTSDILNLRRRTATAQDRIIKFTDELGAVQGSVGRVESANVGMHITNSIAATAVRLLDSGGVNSLIFRESSLDRTIWHSGNDGPSSGLNADLLDGTHLSALVTLAGAQTISGTKTFSSGDVYIGVGGSGDSFTRYYDDGANAYRYLGWIETESQAKKWKLESYQHGGGPAGYAMGSRVLHHDGNTLTSVITTSGPNTSSISQGIPGNTEQMVGSGPLNLTRPGTWLVTFIGTIGVHSCVGDPRVYARIRLSAGSSGDPFVSAGQDSALVHSYHDSDATVTLHYSPVSITEVFTMTPTEINEASVAQHRSVWVGITRQNGSLINTGLLTVIGSWVAVLLKDRT